MRNISIVCLAVLVAVGSAHALDPAQLKDFNSGLDEALFNMGMTRYDLRIRHDYARPDVFRLPMVDSLMHDPASLPKRMDDLAGDLEAESLLAEIAYILWDAMSVEPEARAVGHGLSVQTKDVVGRFTHLPLPLRQALSAYLAHIGAIAGLRDSALAGVRCDLGFLYANLPFLIAPDNDFEGVGPFELHELEKAEEALADSILTLCQAIDMTAVASMSYRAIQAAEDLRVDIEAMAPMARKYERYRGGTVRFHNQAASVTGKILYMGLTPYGPIVVGGSSSNTYSGCFAAVIDLGANDIYELTNQEEVSFRLLIDCAGNDTYQSADSAAVAGAVYGTSVLMDLAGDDSYRSRSISLGAAMCGVGLLYDRSGDDAYSSDAFSQGAGFLGLGILEDRAGNDTYVAGMQSQAFGYVMGSGLLYEAGGNDVYHTKMSQTDILRYDDHFLTLSQGCAFGSRPDYSGGIGLLLESSGNDLYSSDIFGQGVAYWFAVGAIIDRAGHDRYCSYQYAQGSGVHLAFGLLSDESGNDFYESKGVSHGCGHDLSLGLLADFSGNDCYTATDLSQGAGNANGTGILYDAGGTDSYSAKSTVNVNGYGNYRREFGSIGLHIDSRGRDFYGARGEDETLWESGTYGLGMDASGETESPQGDLLIKGFAFEERDFTPHELFILSSRGEPRFQEWREYAFDRMVEDFAASIDYLRGVLDTKDARERHTIKDILRKIGEPAVPMLSEAVREGNDGAQAEASWILGLIGNPDAFDALLELSHSESWKLRSSGLNALGKLKDLSTGHQEKLLERIGEILSDETEIYYVKKDAAFAAGNQHLCGSLDLLASSLEADHYAIRFASSEAIRSLAENGCAGVAETITKGLISASPVGLIAMLHAAHTLEAGDKKDIAEAVLDLPASTEASVAYAVAKLLNTTDQEQGQGLKSTP